MTKSFLVIEEGLIKEKVLPMESQISIGRKPESDLHLEDPTVSREHALVYKLNGHAIVEDLGSGNGTYVNEERVTKAILSNGDTIQVGKGIFRFVQHKKEQLDLSPERDTLEFSQAEVNGKSDASRLLRRSERLFEAISKAPLFSSLDKAALEQISQAAELIIFDRGKTIFQQGDPGRSLYIILDGKVRVFTYNHQGEEIPLTILSENRFFGEISLLTGSPRTATVQAVEETLVCRLSFEVMREILHIYPAVKGILVKHYQKRSKDTKAKKERAGFVERRRHPRYNVQLPVRLSFSTTSQVPAYFKEKAFRTVSEDISISGIRIELQDRFLLGLPLGCQLRLEIFLPQSFGRINCLGILRNTGGGNEEDEFGYLGIEFDGMCRSDQKRLNRFLLNAIKAKRPHEDKLQSPVELAALAQQTIYQAKKLVRNKGLEYHPPL